MGSMSTRDWTTRASAAGAPVLFVVDADPQARTVTESALARRFGADYQVVTADAPQAGLDALARLAAPRRPGGAAGGGPAPARHGRRGVPGAGAPAAPRREPGPACGDGPLPHSYPLHRAGDAAAGDRARPDRLLGREGMGHPRRVAVPAGAGGAQRLDDGPRAEACGLPHRGGAMVVAQPHPAGRVDPQWSPLRVPSRRLRERTTADPRLRDRRAATSRGHPP